MSNKMWLGLTCIGLSFFAMLAVVTIQSHRESDFQRGYKAGVDDINRDIFDAWSARGGFTVTNNPLTEYGYARMTNHKATK